MRTQEVETDALSHYQQVVSSIGFKTKKKKKKVPVPNPKQYVSAGSVKGNKDP